MTWKGIFGREKEDIVKFLNNYANFSKDIKKYIEEARIFLIPLNEDKRMLERIESSIYNYLKIQNDRRVMIFINGVRFNKRRCNEKGINVQIKSDILNLPKNFKI